MITWNEKDKKFYCDGCWDLASLPALSKELAQLSIPSTTKTIILNGSGIEKMDTAAAFLLIKWLATMRKNSREVEYEDFPEMTTRLLELVEANLEDKKEDHHTRKPPLPWVAKFGKQSEVVWFGFLDYLNFIGRLTFDFLRLFKKGLFVRLNVISQMIYECGFLALPIIALLSMMIGVVITYQMGLQLKSYGANIYIVDLLGIAILREFAPLLTAIMVAGRTGSAFTAEIGMMKLNQEVDSLNTLGVPPGEILLLPRIIALLIALPLLTMWANIFGILGGIIMSTNMLGLTWHDFLIRFPNVIPLKSLLIGLGKAPVFALIISTVGCYQGMKVEGGAESVGKNTTRSVVLSIFCIILADAVFSILFSWLKL